MSEKIEQVARAMVANDSDTEGSILFNIHLAEFGDGYRSSAKAAIEAMRIPTAAMMTAGSAAGRAHTTYVDNQSARIIFEAMINAALEEEQ